jgi:hypothetical protein
MWAVNRRYASSHGPAIENCARYLCDSISTVYRREALPPTHVRMPSRWSVPVDVRRMKQHHHLSSMREILPGKQPTRESVPTQLRMPPCVTTRGLVRKVSGRAVVLSRCPLFNRFLILITPSYMVAFRSTNVFRPPAADLRAGEFNNKR